MKKNIIIACLLLLSIFLVGSQSGLHFKETTAINETNTIQGEVKIVRSLNINDYGKAVLFENNGDKTFGVVELEKKFGFLFRFDGGTTGHWIEEGKPFEAAGIGDTNDFLVAIKTAKDSGIKYIALGNHMEGVSPSDTYEVSLKDVKAKRDDYHLKEVIDHYVLFVLDDYTEDTWTIRAFDKDGKLIADKLFGGEARYIDWK
ncbi:MAG: hypothetical protein ACQEXQ_15220 [Bacillota bacterium]